MKARHAAPPAAIFPRSARLSNIGRLAVAAMIDVASRSSRSPVSMADVARRQGISRTYMEMMLGKLRRHKLVKASRGPGGGYTLARSAETISVGDIVRAIDGEEGEAAGMAKPVPESRCSTDELWSALAEKMAEHLDSVSLASLAEAHLARGGVVEAASRSRALAAGSASQVESAPPNSVFAPGALGPR